MTTNENKFAIAVFSCDKYQDLWIPFLHRFRKNWPDCEFPIYIFSNTIVCSDPNTRTILSGIDRDWSTSIMSCLKQIEEDYLFVFFDDVFLSSHVNKEKIDRLIRFIQEKQPEYLRFRRFPRPEIRVNAHFGVCVPDRLYRTSIFAIWNREILLELMQEGESAWDFEHNSVQRSRPYVKFYGVYEEYFDYLHGVERGVWYRRAYDILYKEGILDDNNQRRVMHPREHLNTIMTSIKMSIFDRTPSQYKPFLIKLSSGLRSLMRR